MSPPASLSPAARVSSSRMACSILPLNIMAANGRMAFIFTASGSTARSPLMLKPYVVKL